MKRYDHYGTLDGGGPAEAIEEPDGDWVRYADAQAAISAAVAAERERCAKLCEDRRERDLRHGHIAHAAAADDCARMIRMA